MIQDQRAMPPFLVHKDKHMKHYDVEYRVVGTFTDQIYDVDNEDEAVEKAMDNLRYDPIIIHDSDVEILIINEIDYESGEIKNGKSS